MFLAVLRSALLLLSFDHLTRLLTQNKRKDRITILPYVTIQKSLTISRAICKAANNTPWDSACLVQSLCAHRMFRRRGIPGILYLGVMKEKNNKGKMKAHAWSEVGEKILTGGAGHKQYTVIAVYTWNGTKKTTQSKKGLKA